MMDDRKHIRSIRLSGAGSVGIVLLVLLIAIVIGIGVLAIMPRMPEETAANGAVAVPVATAPVTVADVPEIVTYPGRVEAETEATLASEGMGRITSLEADKGDAVVAGQLLMSVDNRTQSAALRAAEANLRQATNDLGRLEELRATGAVSASDYDAMQTRRELAEIALTEADVALAKCELHSPIDGVVLDRRVEVGEFVAPGTPAFTVADVSRVRVVVELPERDVFAVQPGQEVPFEVESLGGRAFAGKVAYVAEAGRPLSNTFRTEIQADNANRALKPGIIVRIRLTRRIIRGAMTVPLEALVPGKGEYVAYVADGGTAVRRTVGLAAIVDSRAVIRNGLSPGEQVIVEGQRLVSDGVAVRTKAAEEKTATQ